MIPDEVRMYSFGWTVLAQYREGDWWVWNGIGWQQCDGPDDARLEGYCGA